MADSQLLYAYLADWEFECCGNLPEVGGQIEWQVEVVPAEADDRYALAEVTWVPGLGIVRFPGGSAGVALHAGDLRHPVSLTATWHGVDEPAVTVHGTVAEVSEAEGGVVVGIRVHRIIEPTPAQADEAAERRDRNARTIGLTTAAEVFGAVLPVAGDRMAIDMDDPRIRQAPGTRPRTGVVYGVIGQVSSADLLADGPGPARVFLTLVCDR